MTFLVTWKSHVRQAWPIIFYATLPIIIPVYLSYVHGIEDVKFGTILAFAFFGLILVPHFLIHYRYTILSSGVTVKFDGQHKKITFKSRDDQKVVHDHDIASIDMVLTRSLARDELIAYPWQAYGYAIIRLRSGEKLLITSLLVPRMKIPYEFRELNVRESLYCWPY